MTAMHPYPSGRFARFMGMLLTFVWLGLLPCEAAEANTAPVITTPWTEMKVFQGADFSFSITATGTPPLTYQWRRQLLTGENAIRDIPGATSATLTLPSIRVADAGLYYVTVTNGVGSTEAWVLYLKIPKPPEISSQQGASNQAIRIGGSISFSFYVSATPPTTIEIKKDGVTVRTYTEPYNDSVFGGLNLANAQASDSGVYRVTAINIAGTATSPPITVVVEGPPTLTSQPANQALLAGNRAVFSVTATSITPLRYQWKKNGTPLAGATLASLTLENIQSADSATYAVDVVNSVGEVSSVGATLAVNIPPALVTQPAAMPIAVGLEGTLAAGVTGSAPFSFQWKKDGQPVNGATNSTLKLSSAQLSDAGNYTVEISNPFGTTTSNPAHVSVGFPPKFTLHPIDQFAPLGGSITFTAAAAGTGPLTYRWLRGSEQVQGEFAAQGINATSFTLPSVAVGDYKYYALYASNAFGEAFSKPGALRPDSLVFTIANATQAYDGTAKYITITTTPPNIPINVGYYDIGLAYNKAIPTTAPTQISNYYVTIQSLDPNHPSSYGIGAGSIGLNPMLRIVPADGHVALSGLQQTYDGTGRVVTATTPISGLRLIVEYNSITSAPINAGTYAVAAYFSDSFSYTGAAGTLVVAKANQTINLGPLPTSALPIGTDVYLQTGASSSLPVSRSVVSGNATFAGEPLRASGPGVVVVRASQAGTNNYNPVSLDFALSTDSPNRLSFYAITPKLSSNGPFSLVAAYNPGTNVSFKVMAGPATVSGDTVTLTGATGVVTIRAYPGDSDPLGPGLHVDQSFTVFSETTPTLLTTPASQNKPIGGIVTFTVATTDSALVTYQWEKDGSTISGATNATLTLSNLQLTDQGAYTVRVTNGLNTVVSGAAPLMVGYAPTVVIEPLNPTVLEGASTTLVAKSGGSLATTYQWFKGGNLIAGATTANLALTNVQASDAGSYAVAVSNIYGNTTATPSVVAVNPVMGARQAVARGGYTAGGTVTLLNTLFYSGVAISATWRVTLPAGWSFASSKGDETAVKPVVGATGTIEWSWAIPPTSPISFTYALNVPAGATGTAELRSSASVTRSTETTLLEALPGPLTITPAPPQHSADIDRDGKISLSELLRVIELYSTHAGSIRTGAYRLDALSDDGFTPDPNRAGSAALTNFHSADSNHDGRLSLIELTRVLELYGWRSGIERTGAYHVATSTTEDGFTLGP